MERSITIDKSKCISCGLCIKDCFCGCLEFDEEKHPRYRAGAKKCVRAASIAWRYAPKALSHLAA